MAAPTTLPKTGTTMTTRQILGAAFALALATPAVAADQVRARDQVRDQTQDQTRDQTRDQQRLRDGSGAGSQNRYGAQGAARGDCDGTMKRDRLRDGSGAGGGAGAGKMARGGRR